MALAISTATTVEAQSHPTTAELQARLDSLRPLVARAKSELEARETRDERAAHEAAAAVARVDTLRVGLVTVVTPVEQADVARELFTDVWEASYSLVRRSPTLERSTFAFQWSDDLVPIHLGPPDAQGRQHRIEPATWTRRARVEDEIREAIGVTLAVDLGAGATAVGRWAGANPWRARAMEEVYRRVATTQSRVTRSCLEGDTEACGSAMGLGPRPTPAPLEEWYTAEERRLLVTGLWRLATRRLEPSGWSACVGAADTAACDRLLVLEGSDWTPLDGTVRATLLAYALERGGEGAWERLLADPGMTPIDALEHASGVPISELLSGWRARLVANRPDTYEGLAQRSGTTLVWTLFFAALALRSTRWRLG